VTDTYDHEDRLQSYGRVAEIAATIEPQQNESARR